MRRSFTLFSIVAHAIVISALFIWQTLAIGPLPIPHQVILFAADRAMPVEVQPPQAPRRAAPSAGATLVSPNAAPIVAPAGVTDETGLEDKAAAPAGLVAGPESGPPPPIEGLGITSTAPPPAPAPAVPIRLHSGMQAPRKTGEAAPIYPAIARSAHVQGVVILEAVVDIQGRVASVRVLRSIPLLDQAAVEAVQQWRYTPALLNGQPVPVVMTVTVDFRLQ